MKNVVILEGEPFDWKEARRATEKLLAAGREMAAAFFADPGVISCPKCKTYFWREGRKVQCTECGHIWDV